MFLRKDFLSITLTLFYIVLHESLSQREFGLEDFTEIRATDTFVDKTKMIKEIFEKPSMLITAPRHFGKSINFDMVSLFLRNDQNKSEIEEIFRDTNIWSDKEFVRNHMTNHPVLYCNFDSGLEVTCEESLMSYYRQILFGVYVEHEYLKDSPVLGEEERKRFIKCIEENEDLERPEIIQGLQFIINALFLHHNKQVIVMFDEYDANVVNDMFNMDNSSYTDSAQLTRDIVNFQMDLFRSTMKNTHQIRQILITGTLPVQFINESCPIVMQHISFMMNKDLARFYGFTSGEVTTLIKKFKLRQNESEQLHTWYDGYSSMKTNIRIFSPWSVLKFLELKLPFGYWIQTFPIRGLLFPLMNKLQIQETIVKLVNSETVSIKLKETLTVDDISILKKIINRQWKGISDVDIFFQFLLQVGYLTYDTSDKQEKRKVAVRIPNKEILDELSSIIKTYFSFRIA